MRGRDRKPARKARTPGPLERIGSSVGGRGVTGVETRAQTGGPVPDPQPADLSPPSAVPTPQLRKPRPRGNAQSRGPGSKVCPGAALLPSGPGCHLPPVSQTRRPPSRCCGPGRPRLGASAAPSFSSTAPWQRGTEVRPPRACRQPCGPRCREPGRGRGLQGRTNGAAGRGGHRVYAVRLRCLSFCSPRRIGAYARTHT